MPPTRKPKTAPTQTPPAALDEHRNRLVALRDKLTDELATAPPQYVAGIARQLQAVLAELLLQPNNAEPSALDLLIQRRRDRLQAEGIPEVPSRVARP